MMKRKARNIFMLVFVLLCCGIFMVGCSSEKKNTLSTERINPHTTSELDEVIDNIFWTCPDCGRSNQGVMEHCPICGAGRPES